MLEVNSRNPRRWLILVVLCLSTLVLVIDNLALNVAIPPLTEDIGASAQDIQWIMESYMLVFAGLLLTTGSLSDRFGRRKVMIIGLALFGLASLAGAIAATPGQLIAARIVMGVGAALVMPSTLSIMITVFADEERRKAMSAWGSVAMLGLVGGPVIGGMIISHFWWGAVFLINVPIAVVAIIAATTLMPESKGPWEKADPIGAVLSTVGMTALVWTINELPKDGIGHTSTQVSLGLAIAGLVGFIAWELHTDTPMVPLQLFRKRNFSGGSFSLTLVQIGNAGLLLVLTQYLQSVLDYSPTKAGLGFIPLAIAALIFNGLGAGWGQRTGNRPMILVGLVIMAGGFAVLASLSDEPSFATLAAAMALIGAGSGLAMPAAINALMGEIPAEKAGVGSALNDTIQQAGAALGVAILGSLLTSGFAANMPDSAPETAKHDIGAALIVAKSTGDTELAEAARHAFAESMATTFWIGMAGILAAAVVALVTIRDRKATPADDAVSDELPEPGSEQVAAVAVNG